MEKILALIQTVANLCHCSWLMKKGRYQKGYANFCRIRSSELIAAREFYFAHCQILAEGMAFEGSSLLTRAVELFTVPRIRRASVASAIIVIGQQFSGINIMVRKTGYPTKFGQS